MPDEKNRRFLPTYKGCFVCGQKETNSNTLNLRFEIVEDGVSVTFKPGPEHEGYKDKVHGGIICALLDETVGWAVAVARGRYFVTGEINVRFVRPLVVGTEVTIKGRAVEHKSRYSVAEGEVTDRLGTIYARATGKFFLMSEEHAQAISKYMTFREDDLDVLAKRPTM